MEGFAGLFGKGEKGRLGAAPHSLSHSDWVSQWGAVKTCLFGRASNTCKSWHEATVTRESSGSLRPDAEILQSSGKPWKGTTIMYQVPVTVYLTIWPVTLTNRNLQAYSGSESYTHMHLSTTWKQKKKQTERSDLAKEKKKCTVPSQDLTSCRQLFASVSSIGLWLHRFILHRLVSTGHRMSLHLSYMRPNHCHLRASSKPVSQSLRVGKINISASTAALRWWLHSWMKNRVVPFKGVSTTD